MVNYDIYKKEKIAYFIGTGPGIALLRQTASFEFTPPYFTQSGDFSRNSINLNSFTGSLIVGIRYIIYNKIGAVLYSKYEYGFQKIKLGWFPVSYAAFTLNTGIFF